MKPIQQWTTADISEWIKTRDKKSWIKIGGGAVAALVVLFVFVIPGWITRPLVKNKIKSLEIQISTTQTLFKRKPELMRNKEEFYNFLSQAKARLYKPGESSLLLGSISKLAQESKIAIISSSPKDFQGKFPEPFNQTYEANAYDFSAEGGYHELGQFISKIESNPKLLRIELFSLKPEEEVANKHMLHMSLSAVSFKKDLAAK